MIAQDVPAESRGDSTPPAPVEPAQASVERVSIDSLHVDPANVRVHDERNKSTIRASLARFGPGRSIVLDKNNVVRAGNGTLEQARQAGFDEVLVIEPKSNQLVAVKRPDWSDTEATAYSVQDNRSTDLSRNDDAALAATLEAVRNEDASLLEATGYTGDEVDELLRSLADNMLGNGTTAEDPGPQIDRADELQKKWGVKLGDMFIIPSKTTRGGEHRLLCGDSTKAEDVARVMGGEKAAIVSDPPYGINVDTSWLSALNVQRGKPANKSDDKLQNDDGSLDLSWVYRWSEWLVFGFPYLARSEMFSGLFIWDKRGDGGENALGNPVEIAASNAFNGMRLSRHVWAGYIREAGEKREPHPTQKPIGVIADAIQLVHEPVIFDPFVGSGTTLCAAEQVGRLARGIEISPKYVSVVLERLLGLGLEPRLSERMAGLGLSPVLSVDASS